MIFNKIKKWFKKDDGHEVAEFWQWMLNEEIKSRQERREWQLAHDIEVDKIRYPHLYKEGAL